MAKNDFEHLTLDYVKTDKRYVSIYKNGEWDSGALVDDEIIHINESAAVFQYAQTIFEGLKAYTTKNGNIVVFRPDLNAERFYNTAERLVMPPFPKDRFVSAVMETVKANKDYVPPYGKKGSLYIRPFMIGSGPVINVVPANEYQFRIFTSPMGSYFDAVSMSMKLNLSDYDRAAPHGTGHVKAGLNYAMSYYAGYTAKKQGFNENMYLDAATHTYVEESGGANIIFVNKDGTLIVPKSDTILPSITRRSLIYIAKEYLNIKVEERPVEFKEIIDFEECGLCGTAAVISPVGSVHTKNGDIVFKDSNHGLGPIMKKLFETYTGIQKEEIEAPRGWLLYINA